jgi:hypothetical protein
LLVTTVGDDGVISVDASEKTIAQTYETVAKEFMHALSDQNEDRAFGLLALPANNSEEIRQSQHESIRKGSQALAGCSGSSVVLFTGDGSSTNRVDDSIFSRPAFRSGQVDANRWFTLTPPCGNAGAMDPRQQGPVQRCAVGMVLAVAGSDVRALRVDRLYCEGSRPT